MTRYHHDIKIPDIYDIQLEEKKIIKFWNKEQIFEKIRTARCESNDGKLSFHSGPVFPTGFPHSGHILNGIVKDVFTHYGHRKNLKVESKFGWDCHGLPVEHEVDKKLEIKSPEDIQKLKIATYNEECRKFVQRNASGWSEVFERMGIVMNSAEEYKTMSMDYMESVWSVFKQLYEKDLVYKDTKVLPYSTACFTHLSNFEAQQNCKEVTEVGMTISVNIANSDEKLLIWTTTPWALVLNSAVCINPKAVYLKVKVLHRYHSDSVYILSKNSLQFVFPNPSEYSVLEELIGESLQDLQLKPLFEYIPVRTDMRILLDNSVADDAGTGVEAIAEIGIESLKQRGHVLNTAEIKHNKPYCWRSDIPLTKRQSESWFIRVEVLTEELLMNISKVNWHPDNKIKENHFTNWLLHNPKDWAISRTRYWGTPIPIWSSPSGDEVICVGSIAELKRLTGKTNITDLHRECVDWMVIPSRTPGNPPLRRVPEVFDCWFESAAVPFAHKHHLSDSFPVDFVAEGIDQMYGWFYTMMVLSTALSQPAPFLNVFATGLVQEPDGSKVSKRKHNHNDPMRLVEKYGADAFRLYLLNSPLMECEDFVIREEEVANITKTVIQPLYKIFYQCSTQLGSPSWVNYGYVTEWYPMHNVIDSWVLSSIESLMKFYDEELKAYRPHTFLPKAFKLIQDIRDWYMPIRHPETASLLEHPISLVLYNVIYRLCLMLAPVAPFITENIYQILRRWTVFYRNRISVHGAPFIPIAETMINASIEAGFIRMQAIAELVRAFRVCHFVPVQYQINQVVVIHHNENSLNEIEPFKETITKFLNVRSVRLSKDHHEFGATLKAELKPNSALSSNQTIKTAIHDLTDKEIESLIQEDSISILKYNIPLDEVQFSYEINKQVASNYVVLAKEDLVVVMEMNKGLFYYEEGTIKAFANRIRNLKKKANYYPSDFVTIYYSTKDDCLRNVLNKHGNQLEKDTNCELKFNENSSTKDEQDRLEDTVDIKGIKVMMHLIRNKVNKVK